MVNEWHWRTYLVVQNGLALQEVLVDEELGLLTNWSDEDGGPAFSLFTP